MTELHHYIGGELTPASGEERFFNDNPATGQTLCTVHSASAKDVERAITAAQSGFRIWAAMPAAQRARVMYRAAELLRQRNDELARLETLDTGKPFAETSVVDVVSAADCIEYYAGLASKIHGEHHAMGEDAFVYTRREPLGICLGIGAWNYPLQIAAWKSAPALAAGNAMIFKPAELTPVTAIELAKAYTEAGMPAGVFNVVHGAAEVGRQLVSHPKIAKVSLTGEVGTGKKVMAAAASTLKSVTLELGGKSPLVIFDDAKLANAVSGALLANFYSAGEVCSNGTRVFVHESVHDDFVTELVRRTKLLRVGDPLDASTDIGSLISAEHTDKVMSYIKQGCQGGATLAVGGKQININGCSNFVEPTVFTQCKDNMAIVREEIFGPVMSVLSFSDEQEVIRRANNTEFGLSAGVFTQDLARAHRVIAQLEAGTCWINNYNITPVEVPFGGNKQSGIGRENGLGAINHFTQEKTVYVELGDVEDPYPS